jgi:hypothetical protein
MLICIYITVTRLPVKNPSVVILISLIQDLEKATPVRYVPLKPCGVIPHPDSSGFSTGCDPKGSLGEFLWKNLE